MIPHVIHPLLRKDVIEARAYQLEGVAETLEASTLLIYPTAAGKTVVSAMVVAEKIHRESGFAVLLAPTVGLVDQHYKTFKNWFSEDIRVNTLTGSQPAKRRKGVWQSSDLVVATPQVFRNDVQNGLLDPSDLSMLVLDEAHHSVGNHAMGQSADLYVDCSDSRILAMTASPGYSKRHVQDLCKRLAINRIHMRSSSDSSVKKYLSELDILEIRVDVPVDLKKLAHPFNEWQESLVDVERRLGRYVHEGRIGYAGLSGAMDRAKGAIRRGDGSAYASVSRLALAMTLNHLINHLLSQGVGAAREFLSRKAMGESRTKKSGRDFLKDHRVSTLMSQLDGLTEIHSKIGTVRRLVVERLRRNPKSKIIIFATFRDTVSSIHKAIENIDYVKALKFVGQAKKNGVGLTSSQQIETIDLFRKGDANVLVATSVGEEGLDIPSADLVVFYEPVGSEIRTIQRRGRTGRRRQGDVIVLIAEGTRDEGAANSSQRREEAMLRSIHSVRRSLLVGPIDYSVLDSFSVSSEQGLIDASSFIQEERERYKHKFSISDTSNEGSSPRIPESAGGLDAKTFRPWGQSGLDDF